jgi:hypothetical protein
VSIDANLVATLDAQTTAGRRVTVGLRLQSSALPALTVNVQGSERAALGTGAASSLVRYTYTLNAVAVTMADAMALAESAATVVQTAYAAAGKATYRIQEPQLNDTQMGEGDEQEPAIATVVLESLIPE